MKSFILSIVILFGGTMMTNAQDIIQRPNSYNYTKGIDLAHEGKTSEALESFEKELKDNPKNGYAYSWIGAIYIKLEEYGSALSAIKNSLKYLPAKDEDFVANSYKALSTVYLNLQDTLQAYTKSFCLYWNLSPGSIRGLLACLACPYLRNGLAIQYR